MLYEDFDLTAGLDEMSNTNNKTPNGNGVKVQIHLCIPEDQKRHLPKRRRAPAYLPLNVPLPRHGEVIYLSSTSAWGVAMVIHEWQSPDELRVEIWLEHVSASRHARPTGFPLTQ